MGIEPTGEYRKLFSLFDPTDTGTVDMREVLLGMAVAMDAPRDKKIEFMFELFDEDRNGYLTEKELVSILKANHFAGSAQAVSRQGGVPGGVARCAR